MTGAGPATYAEPFVGGIYREQPFRVLVVGESHYSEDAPAERAGRASKLTQEIVEERIERGWHRAFFGVVETVLASDDVRNAATEDVRRRFWSRLAFMNFVSRVIDKGSTPNPPDFRASILRFRDAVARLDPQLVCFFSAAAWDHRPWGEAPYAEAFGVEPIARSASVTVYPRADGGRPYVMARFNHPRRLSVPIDIWRAWYVHVVQLATSECERWASSGS